MDQHFRNERDYYEFINYVNKKYEEGDINNDEKALIISMATNEESARRRTEREALKSLIDIEDIKEGQEGYYYSIVYKVLEEKYYDCKYNIYDLKKAEDNCLSCLVLLKENNTQEEFECFFKLVFEDAKDDVIDLKDITGKELYELYINKI